MNDGTIFALTVFAGVAFLFYLVGMLAGRAEKPVCSGSIDATAS